MPPVEVGEHIPETAISITEASNRVVRIADRVDISQQLRYVINRILW